MLKMILSKRFWSGSGFANAVIYFFTRITLLWVLSLVIVNELVRTPRDLFSLVICVILLFMTIHRKAPSKRSFLYLLSFLLTVIGIVYINMT